MYPCYARRKVPLCSEPVGLESSGLMRSCKGGIRLRFECVGYETLDQEIVVNADSTAMTVKLKRSPLQLGEVVVTPGDEEHAHFEKTTDLNLSAQSLANRWERP